MRLDKNVGSGLTAERPFPGLRPFGYGDRDFFFGREDQIFSLYRLLDLSRFIAVIGSSGSGKSSLVRAGLLPLTDQEAQESGGRDWRSITMHPGDAPLSELANALAGLIPSDEGGEDADIDVRRDRINHALRRSSFGLSDALDEIPEVKGKALLIVVDQFEELFRFASNTRDRVGDSLWRDESANFVQLLLEVSRDRSRSVHVLITMRSDFIGDCAQFHGLPEAVSGAQFLAPSLTRDQREDVIRRPIEKAGATIEAPLVERLLNDVSSELDQLPVLQHCLLRLWDQAGKDAAPGTPRNLTLEDYQKVGRISGALSQHADEVMASLPGLELAVEQVFRALSEVDKEGRATRRALFFSQLLAETGVGEEQLRKVLDRFRAGDCSFILPSPATDPRLREDTRVDVVHEALLRRWDRISAETHELRDGQVETGWLAAEERDGRFYRALLALVEAAPATGAVTLPLDQVEPRWKWWTSRPRTAAWAERYGGGLPRVEKLFSDSRAALEADRKRQIEQQQRERDEERQKIEAAEAAKRAELEHQAEMAAIQTEAAKRLTARTRVAAIAMGAITLVTIVLGLLSISFGYQANRAKSEALVALAAADKAKRLADTEKARAELNLSRLQTMTKTADRERLRAIAQQKIAEKQSAAAVAAAFDAQQQRTAAESERQVAVGQRKIAETQSAEAIRQRAAVFQQAGRDAFFNGDNDSAAVYFAAAYADKPQDPALKVVLREALDKLSIRGGSIHAPGSAHAHSALITTVKFSPNAKSRQIATAGADGTAKLWDTSGNLLHTFTDQSGVITALAFDPTGRYLATTGADGSVKIRDLRGITPKAAAKPLELEGHTRRINDVLFSHDGTRLATASGDGNVRLWQSSTGKLLEQLHVPNVAYQVNDVAFTPDDKLVVAAASDGALRVWNAATGALVWDSSANQAPADKVATLVHVEVATDGKSAVAGAVDGSVVAYDLTKKKRLWVRHDDRGAINAVAFDPSGKLVLSGSDDGIARMYDAQTGDPKAVLARSAAAGDAGNQRGVVSALFSPSSNCIATTYTDGSVSFWTLNGDTIAELRARGGNAGAADFSPDGSLFVTGARDGDLFVWHPPSTLVRADAAQAGSIDSIAVDGNGAILTASRDGTAVVWRLGPLGATLIRERVLRHSTADWVVAASFSHDGKKIVTAGGTSVKVWSVAAPTGAAPLSSIAAGAGKTPQRFSDAVFAGDRSDAVIVAETNANTSDFGDTAGRWFMLSADGKRSLSKEPLLPNDPAGQPEITTLFPGHDARYVLAISGTGTAVFTSVAKNQRVDWDDPLVAAAASAHRRDLYALGGIDGSITLRSAAGSRASLGAQQGRVSALAFSPDDQWFGSAGSGDLVAMIWDLQGNHLQSTLHGHKKEITSIAFSPGTDSFVLTTSLDGSAKLWDRGTGDLLASVSVPGSLIRSAAFTASGSAVVIGSANGSVYLWRIRDDVPPPDQTAKDLVAALKRGEVQNGSADLLLSQAVERLNVASKGGSDP